MKKRTKRIGRRLKTRNPLVAAARKRGQGVEPSKKSYRRRAKHAEQLAKDSGGEEKT